MALRSPSLHEETPKMLAGSDRPPGSDMPRLSVVIPVHDEADNVGPLAREIHAALAGRYDYEMVFVDDGSRDDTAGALRRVREELGLGARLRVIRHARACGQSTAVWTGVREARGALIATLDGDGQNDPADIPRLVEALTAPERDPRLALAIGFRTKRDDEWLRRLSSRVANRVRDALLGDHTPDTGCGLKVFPRSLYLQLPYFDHMHRFTPALVRRQGGAILSVPVGHRPRLRGRSKYGVWNRLWVGIVDLFGVAWLMARERRPLEVEEMDLDQR
jgi:dolichol-phosphate mannosyltransferase